MKFFKILLLFNLIILNSIFLFSNIYSIGVYDSLGELNYYVNNPLPSIKINVSSPFEKINLSHGILTVSNISSHISYNKILDPNINPSLKLIYNFTTPLNENDSVSYKLFAYGQEGLEITPQGDPSNFKIKYDKTKPLIDSTLNPIYNLIGGGNLSLPITFSELINSYTLLINDANPQIFRESSNLLINFKQTFNILLSSNKFNEGNNNVTIKYSDLAGNLNTNSFIVYKIGIPMTIDIVNSPGNYFYDKNYPSFFNKTIYTKQTPFDLSIKTSKPANCFYSSSLINFSTFSNVLSPIPFSSVANNNLLHTTTIASEGNLWVACKNIAIPTEITYLSSQLGMGKNLIKIKKDPNSVLFNILSTFPNSDVTSNTFDLITNTNKKSKCFYQINNNINKIEIPLTNNSNKNHIQKDLNLIDNDYLIKFSCFDLLGKNIEKNLNFNLNSSKGIKITVKDPYYLAASNSRINFTLSQSSNCKFSKLTNQESNFANLSLVTLNGFKGSFKGNYVEGDNIFYIYCEKSSNIIKKKFNAIFSTTPPVISNLVFLNNGIESSYISKQNKLSFKFKVTSIIPMKKYFVKLIGKNFSIDKEILTTSSTLLGENFSAIKSIEIIGENILGKKSSKLTKNLIFDFDAPIIDTSFSGNSFKITCFDSLSGCSKISYGLSKTNLNCIVNQNYLNNSKIIFKNQNFVCINAYDKAGNLAILNKPLILSFSNTSLTNPINSTKISTNGLNLTNKNDSLSNQNNQTTPNIPQDSPIFKNNFSNNNSTSGTNYILIAAIFLLFVGVSGGSYYAYNKGYLNNQLKKLGIKIPNGIPDSKIISSNKFGSLTESKNIIKTPNSPKLTKSNYDKHLNKLNDFIDEKYEKGNKVFNKFDTKNQKGKVKGYKDTLIEIKKNKLSKGEFDEFYASSTLSSKNLKVSNLESETTAFEKFYETKKKKEKNNEKETKTKTKNSKTKK